MEKFLFFPFFSRKNVSEDYAAAPKPKKEVAGDVLSVRAISCKIVQNVAGWVGP